MTGLITQPNLIEQSDFGGGWSPDGEDVTTDPTVLLDVLNLLPDLNTGSLAARPGFTRLLEELTGGSGRFGRKVFHFVAGFQQPHFLIVITAKDAAAANNVKVFAIDLTAGAAQRIDTVGTTWDNPTKPHWGVAISKVWYGGSQGNTMYSWDPTTWDVGTSDNGDWTADESTQNFKTLVGGVEASIDTDTQYGRDYAFTGRERVLYGGDAYSPNRHIRYDTWN